MDVRFAIQFDDDVVYAHDLGVKLDYDPQMPPKEWGQAAGITMMVDDRTFIVPIPPGAVPVCHKRKTVDQQMRPVGTCYRVGWNLMGRRYMISVDAASGDAVLLCDDKGKRNRG